MVMLMSGRWRLRRLRLGLRLMLVVVVDLGVLSRAGDAARQQQNSGAKEREA
jgi:hypothetical protein